MKTIMISENNFNAARNKIRKNKGKKIIFYSEDDELNRKILEKEDISVILLNLKGRKDKMKQRDSGFNQVLAKIAKKKDIRIGINLDEILNHEKAEKARIIGRIMQNIRLCNKNRLKMEFISKRSKDDYDLNALGIILGMPTDMLR